MNCYEKSDLQKPEARYSRRGQASVYQSLSYIIVGVAFSIFVFEMLNMIILMQLSLPSVWVEAVFDATLLVVLLTPVLYFFAFKPLVLQISERERAEEEARLLQDMTLVISEAEDFPSALQVALWKVSEATGWAYGEAWVPSQDNIRLEFTACYSRAKGLDKFIEKSRGFTFQRGTGLFERVWASKKPVWVYDVVSDANFLRAPIAKEAGLRGAMYIPVLADNELVAVIDFFTFKPLEAEDERLINLVSTVATQLGLVIRRKRAEEALKTKTAKLEEANRLKDLFTDVVRHDLLNPAGIIKSFAEMQVEEAKDEEQREIALSIKHNSERLIEMIESASMYAKLESEEKLEKKLDLNEIFKSAADSLNDTLEEKKIKLEHLAKGERYAMVNPMFENVFFNLISNAIKYSPEGNKIEANIIDEGKSWKIYVKDWGYGIPDEDKARLFIRFTRVDKKGIKGTGLGLAIVKRIVDLHRGKVWIEDNPEGGSVFFVELPKE